MIIFYVGCGKSFWLEVFKNYLATKKKELHGNFLKVAAPTGKTFMKRIETILGTIFFPFFLFAPHLKCLVNHMQDPKLYCSIDAKDYLTPVVNKRRTKELIHINPSNF